MPDTADAWAQEYPENQDRGDRLQLSGHEICLHSASGRQHSPFTVGGVLLPYFEKFLTHLSVAVLKRVKPCPWCILELLLAAYLHSTGKMWCAAAADLPQGMLVLFSS